MFLLTLLQEVSIGVESIDITQLSCVPKQCRAYFHDIIVHCSRHTMDGSIDARFANAFAQCMFCEENLFTLYTYVSLFSIFAAP